LKKLKKSLLKYIGINIIFIIIGSTIFAKEENSKYTMNLNEFVNEALKNNHDLKSKKNGVHLKEKDLDIAKGKRLGKLGITMAHKNYENNVAIGDYLNGDYVKDNEKYSSAVTMEIPLYRGGTLVMNQRAAAQAVDSKKLDFSWEEDKLIYNIAKTYYKILENKKLLKINTEHLYELVEQKRIVDEFIHVGKAIKIEGIKEDVEIITTEQEIEFIKNDLKSGYLLLFHLTGMPSESEVTVKDIDEEIFQDYTLENIIAKAYMNRKDYLSLEKEKSEKEYLIKASKGQRKPSVDFVANYTMEEDGNLKEYNNWDVGIQFEYYFFQGGTISSKIKQSKIKKDIIDEKIKELKSNINLEVRDSYFQMKTSLINIKRAKKNIGYAKENLRIEKIKYESEKNRIVDVIDAQNLLLEMKTDYYKAIYNYKMSEIKMKKASGNIKDILKGDKI